MAAEVGGGESPKKGQKKGRAKKPNPRIDMTPMVDLGFLLLTFFVLTTQMSTPTTMPVIVPPKIEEKDKPLQDEVAESKVITILVGEKDRIYWYQGVKEPKMFLTNYSAEGIRKVIFQKQKEAKDKFATAKDPDPLIVILKITDMASYKNAVDILDEMAITNQKKYALVDATPDELGMIEDYRKNNNIN